MNKILVIVAHPDDEVLGMGGTIAKLTSLGKEIHLLIITDGSSHQYKNCKDLDVIIENKKIETKNACDILGIKSITYAGFPDMKLDTCPHSDINAAIEKAILEIEPDTIFTHFYGDVNNDHQCVFKSVMVATRPTKEQVVKELYLFSVPSSTEWNSFFVNTVFIPNYYVDITEYTEMKCEALLCYKTELRDYPHLRSIKYVSEKDNIEGLKVGCESAESFIIVRKID